MPKVVKLLAARNAEDGIALLRAIFVPTPSFEVLRAIFLQRHGKAIVDALLPFWGKHVSLNPVPLTPVAQNRFLQACNWDPRVLLPTFHGTDMANFVSILCRGLLVPGAFGIKVANGSCHGLGIYTAKLSAVSLSLGFNRGSKKLLVCGVVDNTQELVKTERMGGFPVTARSKTVLKIGDAVVVYDPAMVAPLFVAEQVDKRTALRSAMLKPWAR